MYYNSLTSLQTQQ